MNSFDWFMEGDRMDVLCKLGQRINDAVEGHDVYRSENFEAARVWYQKVSEIRGVPRPPFERAVFMGSWCPDGKGSTRAEVAMAHLDLARGLSCLSGIEQNGGQGTAFDEEADREDHKLLETITRNLATALGCSHLLKAEEEVP